MLRAIITNADDEAAGFLRNEQQSEEQVTDESAAVPERITP